jgi:hypothetical protein
MDVSLLFVATVDVSLKGGMCPSAPCVTLRTNKRSHEYAVRMAALQQMVEPMHVASPSGAGSWRLTTRAGG